MKLRLLVACLALFYGLRLIALPQPSIVLAEPHAQATRTPTEEPTKRPYVFPTPVYIPPFADDTPVPRATPIVPLAPGTDTYTVQAGDSPWTIAQKVYGDGTKYKLIMEANGLTDQTRLRVGTVLKIPSLGNPALTPVSTESTPTFEPTPTTTPVTPTVLPTVPAFPTLAPTSATSAIPNSMTDTLASIITIASVILGIGGVTAGVLAYFKYLRARQIEQIESGRQPLRLKR
jgi:LysM repeat protein